MAREGLSRRYWMTTVSSARHRTSPTMLRMHRPSEISALEGSRDSRDKTHSLSRKHSHVAGGVVLDGIICLSLRPLFVQLLSPPSTAHQPSESVRRVKHASFSLALHVITSRPLCLVRLPPRALRCAILEAIASLARNVLERPHAAAAGRLSPLGLLAPVDCSLRR